MKCYVDRCLSFSVFIVLSVFRFTASAFLFGILVKYYIFSIQDFSVSVQCIGQLNSFSDA